MTIRKRLLEAAIDQMVQRTGEKTGVDISESEIYMTEINEAAVGLIDRLLPVILSLTRDEATTLLQEKVIDLRATVLEYEHALQHAVDPHPVPGAPPQEACPDCQRLCQSALDGVNREDFLEIAREDESI